jgi:hypothetical protein
MVPARVQPDAEERAFRLTLVEPSMSGLGKDRTFADPISDGRNVGGSGQAAFDDGLQLAAARSFFVVRGLAVPDELRLWSCDDYQSNNG